MTLRISGLGSRSRTLVPSVRLRCEELSNCWTSSNRQFFAYRRRPPDLLERMNKCSPIKTYKCICYSYYGASRRLTIRRRRPNDRQCRQRCRLRRRFADCLHPNRRRRLPVRPTSHRPSVELSQPRRVMRQ